MERSLTDYREDWNLLRGVRDWLRTIAAIDPQPAIGLEPSVYTPDHFDDMVSVTRALIGRPVPYVWPREHHIELAGLLAVFDALTEAGLISPEQWRTFTARLRAFLDGPYSAIEEDEDDFFALHYWSKQG